MNNFTSRLWNRLNCWFNQDSTRRKKRSSQRNRNRRLAFEPMESRQLLSISPYPVQTISGLIPDAASINITIQDNLPITCGNSVVSDSLLTKQGAIEECTAEYGDPSTLSTDMIRVDTEGRLQVYVKVGSVTDSMTCVLQTAGLQIEISDAENNIIQGWISYSSLDQIASVDGVVSVTPPDYGWTGTWQGCGSYNTDTNDILKAGKVHEQFAAYGITGNGIKIGVISNGVAHLSNSQSTDDLPSVTVNTSLSQSGDEGTAMLEIVHDLAPDAQLFFSPGNTTEDMKTSIQWLANTEHCNVIVDDMTFYVVTTSSWIQPYFFDGPGDSQTDTIADTVKNYAINNGITYVTSAGNWQTPYIDLGEGYTYIYPGYRGHWQGN
jgi:hypothetical protein